MSKIVKRNLTGADRDDVKKKLAFKKPGVIIREKMADKDLQLTPIKKGNVTLVQTKSVLESLNKKVNYV